MEIKINKEIREYNENVYFGLTLRQFVFSILACGISVVLFIFLKPHIGMETLSWVCIMAAAPFAALGFFKYNGMFFEEFIVEFIKSEFLIPKELKLTNLTNYYYELCKNQIEGVNKYEEGK